MMELTIQWRGLLSGCNYDCSYCPFSKTVDTRHNLQDDCTALQRFCEWTEGRAGRVSILFTPWGEAVVRGYYRKAIERLSRLDHVGTVAIQTNLSVHPRWLSHCDLESVGIWATYHPDQVLLADFVERVHVMEDMGVRYSVGVVAVRNHFQAIAKLKETLPENAYLWINAEESIQGKYAPSEVDFLAGIDPLFEVNNRIYSTVGRRCLAGESVISVAADGTARRCHFVDDPIGNIYDPSFENALRERTCPMARCNCHIGYSQLPALNLRHLFGSGFLERRAVAPTREQANRHIRMFENLD